METNAKKYVMLAIVIPYYKITFFEATLQSLASQTDKRFNVYIGDDASSDNPVALLDKYKNQFNFVYHKFEKNLGSISLVKHWERCIALTRNEVWLMILGDDDLLGENVVASWYENYGLFKEKSNVIRFATKIIYEGKKMVSEVYIHPIWESATDSFYRKFIKTTRSSLSEYVFSKSSYLKFGFYDYPLAWNSDDQAWLDFSNNKPIFTINESIVFVRISDVSISGNYNNLYFKTLSEIKFYKLMVLRKSNSYNKVIKLELLKKYEDEIKKIRKLNLFEWCLFIFFNVKYLNIRWFNNLTIKFLKKFKYLSWF